jgi:hypothetical protein
LYAAGGRDAGAEPIGDEEPELVNTGLLLEPEAKLGSEKFTPESSQASEVLEAPAVLEQVIPRLRGRQVQTRASKKRAGKQTIVDETKDQEVEIESSALSKIQQLPEVPYKTRRNNTKKIAISTETTSKSKGKGTKSKVLKKEKSSRSGRKIANNSGLLTETVLSSNTCDLQSATIQPFVTSTADATEVLETNKNVLPLVTYDMDFFLNG